MVQTTIQRATRMVDGILNGNMRINCDQQNYVVSCYFVPPTHMLQMTNPHGMVSNVLPQYANLTRRPGDPKSGQS